MEIKFVKIPGVDTTFFENAYHNKRVKFDNNDVLIFSVGHSWNYTTQIKGWLDWDYPNQKQGVFRDVYSYGLNTDDILVSIVRNPFVILFDYFKSDWAGCKKYNGLDSSKVYDIEEFQKFVDLYLDKSKVFHAPALRNSLFSQLKNINGEWLIDKNTIIIKYESLNEDVLKFSNKFGLDVPKIESKSDYTFEEVLSQYRKDQLEKLSNLWIDDLKYFKYELDFSKVSELSITPKKKDKLKIALCFSGHVRDLERTKQYWTNLINEYDIDVYASLWDIENVELGDTIQNFHKIYNVKKVEVESYSSFEKSTLSILRLGITPPSHLLSHLKESCQNFGTMSMWYKIWRANLLTKEYDIDYDIVIRARTDTYLDDKLDITNNNMLNLPYGRVKTVTWHDSDGISDLFAYGPSKIMDYYSTCYFFMMEHMSKGHYMVPHEHFLHTHMNKVSIPIRFMGTNIVITRTSKGTKDEVYCKGDNVHEHILQSDFMDLNPNTEVSWRTPIKDNFKI
jgi:hypothetical protein